MKIGLDFDNTIVCYNKIFHALALSKNLIPQELAVHKIAVRDYLRQSGKEIFWTEMQGEVYGKQMPNAMPYPFVAEFILNAKAAGHVVYIISHKTKYPFIGPKWDLHQPARDWIQSHLSVEEENVFLELTKESKLNRIKELQCDIFIDDLPEILTDPSFPVSVNPILFDPDHLYSDLELPRVKVYSSWESIHKICDDCEIIR